MRLVGVWADMYLHQVQQARERYVLEEKLLNTEVESTSLQHHVPDVFRFFEQF
jgi:hypothetical protein